MSHGLIAVCSACATAYAFAPVNGPGQFGLFFLAFTSGVGAVITYLAEKGKLD